ncbi:MAG: hypothetical protein KatS3mg105_0509 [Gemmatales bacterium]|nr:MAG: hypothetical protein KatS3mg105_0509 [Gemmatales bacterium]
MTPIPSSDDNTPNSYWLPLGLLALVLICGCVLRLVYVEDMEYKGDEAWTFRHSVEKSGAAFPWLGMPMSTGPRNPGMSLWVFMVLSRIGGVVEPTDLARCVQVLNILALLLLVAFAFRFVEKTEREVWLWASALVAVNPLAVLFQRKIWPPSVLPLFVIIMLSGWWCRRRFWGAFLWGWVGACLGQIHGPGFFFAAGFFLWAWLFDRRGVRWTGWLAGSVLAAWPMIPWVWHLFQGPHGHSTTDVTWEHILEAKFWLRWITESWGLGLKYSLHRQFVEFLKGPFLAGEPTYFVAGLHAVVVTLGILILWRGGKKLWANRHGWRDLFIGRESATAFTISAAFWGFGLLLTFSMLPIHRHYMIVLFPLEFVWLAHLALGIRGSTTDHRRWGRRLLAGMVVAQLLITICFLHFIHANGGATGGDYGLAYRLQIQQRRP